MPNNNPFADWLYDDEDPSAQSAAYFSNQNQWKTPNMKKYFQGQFSNIQNQYMGQLGQMAHGGQAATLEFPDFLKDINWGQEYGQLTPMQRGVDTARFNPFTRWMT